MSEGYMVGDDSVAHVLGNDQAAQTFTPLETHRIIWLDIKIYSTHSVWWAMFEIQETTGGKPNGTVLVDFPVKLDSPYQYPHGKRYHITLSTYPTLNAGQTYAIVLRQDNTVWGSRISWRYDADDSQYPRGQRLFSDDGGNTWTAYPNDDHMFAEWGQPPSPPPPPPPPTDRWAVLTLDDTIQIGGFTVTAKTNTPCHLWLYYSDKRPWVHKVGRILRGLEIMGLGYWCFVIKAGIEQNEPGDTIIHTFTWPDWYSCLTQWFFLHGTIDDEPCPSQSPIFHLHYPYLTTFLVEMSDAWLHNKSTISYLTARDAPGAIEVDSTGQYLYVGQRKIGVTYLLWRSVLHFNLASFPHLKKITHAILELYPRQNQTPDDFIITVSSATGVSEPPILSDYGLLLPQYIEYGTKSTLGEPEGFGHWDCNILINDIGVTYIKYHPSLDLALLSSKDILAIPPANIERLNFWSRDHGEIPAPRLHLFYEL